MTLIRSAEELVKTRYAGPDVAHCPLCLLDLGYPRIVILAPGTEGLNGYHPTCAATVAANITKDLQRLLSGK